MYSVCVHSLLQAALGVFPPLDIELPIATVPLRASEDSYCFEMGSISSLLNTLGRGSAGLIKFLFRVGLVLR